MQLSRTALDNKVGDRKVLFPELVEKKNIRAGGARGRISGTFRDTLTLSMVKRHGLGRIPMGRRVKPRGSIDSRAGVSGWGWTTEYIPCVYLSR